MEALAADIAVQRPRRTFLISRKPLVGDTGVGGDDAGPYIQSSAGRQWGGGGGQRHLGYIRRRRRRRRVTTVYRVGLARSRRVYMGSAALRVISVNIHYRVCAREFRPTARGNFRPTQPARRAAVLARIRRWGESGRNIYNILFVARPGAPPNRPKRDFYTNYIVARRINAVFAAPPAN